MEPSPGWSRSRRWLLEACGRRFVLDHPGEGTGAPPTADLHLQRWRVLRLWRNDLLADRAEGHVWSPRLMRHVLELRLAQLPKAQESDGPARRRLVRLHVKRMCGLLEHPWFSFAVPVGASVVLPDARHDVPFENGRLWAVPDLLRDSTQTAVLFRSGRTPKAVLDLEAALCATWMEVTRGRVSAPTFSVMRFTPHGWIRHVVVVDDHLRKAAAELVRMDRAQMRLLHKRWMVGGHRSLPLAEHAWACEGCAHRIGCPRHIETQPSAPFILGERRQ
jgi:hypothetical protein